MSTEPIVEESTEVVPAESTPALETEVIAEEAEVNAEDVETPEETADSGSAPGAQKRIKQLAAQRKAEQEARIKAEVEREYYKGLAEGRNTAVAQTEQPAPQHTNYNFNQPPAPPVIDNFETFDEYEHAKDEYLVQKAKFELRQEMAQHQAVQSKQERAKTTISVFEKAAQADAQFAEIWTNKALWDSLPISSVMAEAVAASPMSPELIKWVHANRAEAARIATLQPVQAVRELAFIEANLKSAPKPEPPRKVSAAPDPIKTVTPSSPSSVDEDDLPMEEYYKRRTKQLYGR